MSSLYEEMKLEELEKKLGVELKDKKLFQRALTHKSFPNENRHLHLKDNERLEFLGDSVLSLTISTYIFNKFPEYPEGKLAKMRSVIVSAPVLAEKASDLGIGDYLLLGRGETLTGGRERDSILADTMEAIIGAIYLDKGLDDVNDFIINIFEEDIMAVQKGEYIKDYKTMLQELIQKNSSDRPSYFVADEQGPDHNKKFVVKVQFNEELLGKGIGSSKKEAQQKAAKVALKNMGKI